MDEPARLKALRDAGLLDTAPEPAFDDIARLAAHLCGAPIALVSLVETDRQWFKARVGLDVCQTGRDVSFCAHALGRRGLFVVPDARMDPLFADNPLVTGEPHIRFYAGAPLITPEGHALGALCVIDRVPRTLTPDQEEALLSLGRLVMAQMALRRSNAALTGSEARNGALLQASLDCIISMDGEGRIMEWNPAAERTFGTRRAEALGQELAALIIPERFRDGHRRGLAHVLATGTGPVLNTRVEVPAMRRDGTEFEAELTVVPMLGGDRPLFTGYVRDISDRKRMEAALRGSEERFRLLAEGGSDLTTILALDGTIRFESQALQNILGYRPDEMIGRDCFWFVHPEDVPPHPGRVQAACRDEHA